MHAAMNKQLHGFRYVCYMQAVCIGTYRNSRFTPPILVECYSYIVRLFKKSSKELKYMRACMTDFYMYLSLFLSLSSFLFVEVY